MQKSKMYVHIKVTVNEEWTAQEKQVNKAIIKTTRREKKRKWEIKIRRNIHVHTCTYRHSVHIHSSTSDR